jgi:hypothetical protein
LKGRQHSDEKYVKVDGKDCYDLNCTDNVTKYQTAHLFVAGVSAIFIEES